jgi:eukaryotic-like serine/threonine-protein kinase
VAIKLLNEDSSDNRELRERFAREAESVARLRHPNILVIFDVGEDDSLPDV